MIKAAVNITGTIKRNAGIRTDKNGKAFLSITMNVFLPEDSEKRTPIEVFVYIPNPQQADLSLYREGDRIGVTGNMDIKKRNEKLFFYLTSESIMTEGVSDIDNMSGTLTFRGYLKKENVYIEKTDKNGNPYLIFSAYSSEKVGDEYISTWVSFKYFSNNKETFTKPECLRSKAHVNIKGRLELCYYKASLFINCSVTEIEEYKVSSPQ